MIDIIKYDDNNALPVSIIVPLGRSKLRKDFFNNMVLPLLEANMTAEIIINDNEGTAPKKRNDGFKKSTQPFIFFCDDDILLPANYIETLYKTLIKNPNIDFAYTGYNGIVIHQDTHPIGRNFEIPPIEFNEKALTYGNYISTMTLMRSKIFPMFDENLKRLQDWSLFLTIVERGSKGILVPDLTFYAYYLDSGITSNNNSEIDAVNAIRLKHKI